MSINVKEKADGNFIHSFSTEKTAGTSTQRTLHAAVNGSDNAPVNGSSYKICISAGDENVNPQYSLSDDEYTATYNRTEILKEDTIRENEQDNMTVFYLNNDDWQSDPAGRAVGGTAYQCAGDGGCKNRLVN